MIDTFYMHLDFTNKSGRWSINLPFLCAKCGVCCKLEDFLTAGPTKANLKVDAKVNALFKALGERWKANEAEYDQYVTQTPCIFLVDNECSIYEVRSEGCRAYPNTAFGMLTKDCPALNRFKKQRDALKRGRASQETCYSLSSTSTKEAVKHASLSEKQYAACIAKLRQAGATDDEIALFNTFNGKPSGC
jgi:Fe-S-cluster containining protein